MLSLTMRSTNPFTCRCRPLIIIDNSKNLAYIVRLKVIFNSLNQYITGSKNFWGCHFPTSNIIIRAIASSMKY